MVGRTTSFRSTRKSILESAHGCNSPGRRRAIVTTNAEHLDIKCIAGRLRTRPPLISCGAEPAMGGGADEVICAPSCLALERPSGHSARVSGTEPERLIYVGGWQMECCGERFSRGSLVHWTVAPADHDFLDSVLGEELSEKVTDAEEHHHDPAATAVQSLSGVVRSIQAVSCQYAKPSGASSLYRVENTAVLTEVSSTDDARSTADLVFLGWLVSVASATA